MKIISIRYCQEIFSFEINKLSPTDNIFNGKPCDVHTGYLNKDISFGDIVYNEPKNIQYKKLVNGVINRLKISLIGGDENVISGNFKISKNKLSFYYRARRINDSPFS